MGREACTEAMFQLCSRFFGRMAFTVRNASLGGAPRAPCRARSHSFDFNARVHARGSSDWRQHGIPPGQARLSNLAQFLSPVCSFRAGSRNSISASATSSNLDADMCRPYVRWGDACFPLDTGTRGSYSLLDLTRVQGGVVLGSWGKVPLRFPF